MLLNVALSCPPSFKYRSSGADLLNDARLADALKSQTNAGMDAASCMYSIGPIPLGDLLCGSGLSVPPILKPDEWILPLNLGR